MFTGLVEATGEVTALTIQKGHARLTVDVGPLAQGAQIGDSVAINGCCLTVASLKENRLDFNLLSETLSCTNLGHLRTGALVNLERALPAQGRYGGHFVTGHIDATGVIRGWEPKGDDHELRLTIDPLHGIYLVPKGCISVDGISLTVAEVGRDHFSVWIIPHTREVTALRERATGDLVNLEFDLLAKYTEKILASRVAPPAPIGGSNRM